MGREGRDARAAVTDNVVLRLSMRETVDGADLREVKFYVPRADYELLDSPMPPYAPDDPRSEAWMDDARAVSAFLDAADRSKAARARIEELLATALLGLALRPIDEARFKP